jgi:hypothetical protein
MKQFVLCVLVFCCHTAISQDDSSQKTHYKKSYWFDVGFGWGGQGSALNFGLSLQVAPKRLISVHYSQVYTRHRCHDYAVGVEIADYPLGEDAGAWELAYGFFKKGKYSIVTASAGLSLIRIESGTPTGPVLDPSLFGSSCPADYYIEEKRAVGIALRAQFIPSLRWGGLGLSPYLQLNGKYTFASLTVQLALGRLRPGEP